MKTLLALPVAALLCLSAPPAPPPPAALDGVEPVTVILVRHAETTAPTTQASDPQLSDAGRERAADLARLLGHAGVTHLYSSEFERTRATLAPLAAATGLDVQVIGARETEAYVAALRALPAGSVAVVSGHSNTVPGLVEALGGRVRELVDAPPYGMILGQDAFDRLLAVTLPAGVGAATKVVELRYGAASRSED